MEGVKGLYIHTACWALVEAGRRSHLSATWTSRLSSARSALATTASLNGLPRRSTTRNHGATPRSPSAVAIAAPPPALSTRLRVGLG
jgi:hypothetical protein